MAFDFKNWIFKQFPDRFKDDDTHKDINGDGFFERYTRIFDHEAEEEFRVHIEGIFNILSPKDAPLKYLPYLAYQWGNIPLTSFEQVNRKLIELAVILFQTKGTTNVSYPLIFNLFGLNVLVVEHDIPNASRYDDPDAQYDDDDEDETYYDVGCDPCFPYSLAYSSQLDKPSIFFWAPIETEVLRALGNLVHLIEPIDCTLEAMYRNYDVVDDLDLDMGDSLGMNLMGGWVQNLGSASSNRIVLQFSYDLNTSAPIPDYTDFTLIPGNTDVDPQTLSVSGIFFGPNANQLTLICALSFNFTKFSCPKISYIPGTNPILDVSSNFEATPFDLFDLENELGGPWITEHEYVFPTQGIQGITPWQLRSANLDSSSYVSLLGNDTTEPWYGPNKLYMSHFLPNSQTLPSNPVEFYLYKNHTLSDNKERRITVYGVHNIQNPLDAAYTPVVGQDYKLKVGITRLTPQGGAMGIPIDRNHRIIIGAGQSNGNYNRVFIGGILRTGDLVPYHSTGYIFKIKIEVTA